MRRDSSTGGIGTDGFLVALAVAGVPLILTPRLLFHYDVTPKVLLLLFVAAAFLLRPRTIWSAITELWARREGRCLAIVAAAGIAWLGIATAASSRPWFSLLGNNWRRMGFLTVLALAIFSIIAAGEFSRHRIALTTALRAFTGAGIIASIYGILEYFDIDPLQTPSLYHALAGDSVTVRPPGTLGHADYFAWWLAITLFAGLAVARTSKGVWEWAGWITSFLAAAAILLSGTRSALIGVFAGFVFYVFAAGIRIGRRAIIAGLCATALLAVFFWSPAGERMRARIQWARTEPIGGARPLLWKDSLRMAAARPFTGTGPETFAAAFPRYQSIDLARLLPDFYYESPHNSALDALTEQGLPGLLLLAGWAFVGFAAFWNAKRANEMLAAPLAAALVASCASAMFSAMTLGPVFATAIIIAMLVAFTPLDRPLRTGPELRWLPALAVPSALLLIAFGVGLTLSDYRLARFQNAPGTEALALWPAAVQAEMPGTSEDLFASRKLAGICQTLHEPVGQIRCLSLAADASRRAILSADNPPNAWYSFAIFAAARNDAPGVEKALRQAEALAPAWFKPHWTLANFLSLEHRPEEARREAERAETLDAGKDPEVLETLRRFTNEARR